MNLIYLLKKLTQLYTKVLFLFYSYLKKNLFLDNELFEATVRDIIDDYQFFLYENFEHPIKENYFRSMYYNNGTYIDNFFYLKLNL